MKYPEYVYETLRQRLDLDEGDTSMDDVIDGYSREEVLDKMCDWNGLTHWGYQIRSWIRDIYGVDLNEFEE